MREIINSWTLLEPDSFGKEMKKKGSTTWSVGRLAKPKDFGGLGTGVH